ncbi:MAG: extracellular solute-binding protein [Ruminococcus sp.]|jgi:ABC-type glycerol-3-phosphate transport system substrate-binding protein|nr:extracellular solute-binding protein [Ruminococcus sp.]
MKKYRLFSIVLFFMLLALTDCTAGKPAPEPICKATVVSTAGEDYQYIVDALMMEDHLLLLCDSSIITMDFDGNIITKISLEDSTETHIVNYYNLEVSDDGKITFLKTSADIDDKTGKFEKIVFDGEKSTTEDITADIDNYSFGVGENLDDKPSFSIQGLYNIKPRFYFETSDGNFIVIGENSGGYSSVYKTEILSEDEMENRTVIEISSGYFSEIEGIVTQFNEVNPYYKAVIKESPEDFSYTVDIITGDTADVVFIGTLMAIPYESYAKKGVFEDLLPYFEADPEISADDLVQSVIKANMINEALYSIPQSFSVQTMTGRVDLVSQLKTNSFADIKRVADENNILIISPYGSNKRLFIQMFVTFSTNSFVDAKAHKCNFNSQDFIDILNYAENYPTESVPDRYGEDQFLMPAYIGDFRGALSIETMDFGAPISFLGYPSGVGSNGVSAMLRNEAAIYSSSENKDGAWEFIKFMLINGVIEQNNNTSFPIVKTRLEKLAEDSFKEYYINEVGEQVNNRLYETRVSDIEIKLPDLTEADVAEIMSLIDKIDGIHRNDLQLVTILNEEMNNFLDGKVTAEETAAMLQDRVSTYLSETY